MPEKAPKAQAEVTAGMAGNQAQPAKLALASWTRTVEAQGAAQPSENSLVDPEQPDKVHIPCRCQCWWCAAQMQRNCQGHKHPCSS